METRENLLLARDGRTRRSTRSLRFRDGAWSTTMACTTACSPARKLGDPSMPSLQVRFRRSRRSSANATRLQRAGWGEVATHSARRIETSCLRHHLPLLNANHRRLSHLRHRSVNNNSYHHPLLLNARCSRHLRHARCNHLSARCYRRSARCSLLHAQHRRPHLRLCDCGSRTSRACSIRSECSTSLRCSPRPVACRSRRRTWASRARSRGQQTPSSRSCRLPTLSDASSGSAARSSSCSPTSFSCASTWSNQASRRSGLSTRHLQHGTCASRLTASSAMTLTWPSCAASDSVSRLITSARSGRGSRRSTTRSTWPVAMLPCRDRPPHSPPLLAASHHLLLGSSSSNATAVQTYELRRRRPTYEGSTDDRVDRWRRLSHLCHSWQRETISSSSDMAPQTLRCPCLRLRGVSLGHR